MSGFLDVKLGRLGVGGSFYNWSCQFMNLSFCGELPGNIVSTWYNWPVSQWGTRLRLRASEDVKFEAGVYQINPRNLTDGTTLSFAGGDRLDDPGRGRLVAAVSGTAQLPGTYRIGAWYDTANQPDVFLAANGGPQVLNPGVPAAGAQRRERVLPERAAAAHRQQRARARSERVL